jgi:hypothetical protein
MMPTMQTLQPAPTLKDLRDRINEAIEIAGENATWNGFDSEAIYIYHPNDSSKWVAIFPRDRKKSSNKAEGGNYARLQTICNHQ